MPLDIGIGIISAITGADIFRVALVWPLVLWGIAFALLPDIDVFPELIVRNGKLGGKEISWHRELAHFPLTYLPVAALVWIFAGPLWGYMFALGALAHFIHDSIGIGWGIKWAWPFNKNSYKFFADKQNRITSKQFFVFWTPEELSAAMREYGDPDWIKHYYLSWHPVVVTETLVFSIAVLWLVVRLR